MRIRLGRRAVAALFGLGTVATLMVLRLADPMPVEVIRTVAFDGFQRLAPRAEAEFPVRVVDIDEASLAQIGQWPWSRDELAVLTDKLTEMGAAAIAFDFLFPEPDRLSPKRLAETLRDEAGAELIGPAAQRMLPDFDGVFAEALKRSPSVLGFSVSPAAAGLPEKPKAGFAISGVDPSGSIQKMPGAVLPLPELAAAAKGLGSLSLNARDAIGVVRRVPLVWSNGTRLFPALSLEALRLATGAETYVVFGDDGGLGYVQSIRLGDYEIPTTPEGNLTVYYNHIKPELFVSARAVMGPPDPAVIDRIAGHIVLVGTSASGLLDVQATTLGENVAGVAIHAQMLEQILAGSYLLRTDWMDGLELAVLAVAGGLTVGVVLLVGPTAGILTVLGLVAATIGAAWVMFLSRGWLFDPTYPVIALLVTYTAMIFFKALITDADKRRIRKAFGHYVGPELLSEIERNPADLKLGGELKDLTVMFTDVRNFTVLGEKVTPAQLIGMLNALFGPLGNEITASRGTIDKFLGDAIMAFWNAPIDVAEHPVRACETALQMRRVLAGLNARDAFGLKELGGSIDALAIGIGICSGEALVGNMGVETRFDYSCVGDTVNLASRIEGVCKVVGFDIVVAEATRARAPDFAYLEAGDLHLKGKSQRESVHILVGPAELAGSKEFLALREQHERLIARLRFGGDGGELFDHCRRLGAGIEPQLARFYEILATRSGDFQKGAEAPVLSVV